MKNILDKQKIKLFKKNDAVRVFNKILIDGFILSDNCIYIKYFFGVNAKKTIKFVYDDTDRECWVNSVHIEDWYHGNLISAACSLSFYVLNNLKLKYENNLFSCVISIESRKRVTWKLYTVRKGVDWLSSNLEEYDQPVLQIFSDDHFTWGERKKLPALWHL
mgnify:CR=1 FL=1